MTSDFDVSNGSKKPYKLTLGKRGEQLAAEFLEAAGYRILERNLRFGHDELDIIALDGECLVFVEVKSRAQTTANQRYGRPASAVNHAKQEKLKRAVQSYLREKQTIGRRMRIDVIEVYFPPIHADTPIELAALRAERIVHMRNAVYK